MNVYTIVLKRIGTGKPSLAIVTRQDNEEAACAYAQTAMAQSPDLRVADIHARPCDPSDSSAGRHRAAWLRSRQQPGLEQKPDELTCSP
jgi:hypothetical protein